MEKKEIKKKSKQKFLGKVVYWLILLVLFSIAVTTAISALNIPGNFKLLVIQSGSMEPAIEMGSLVVVKKASSFQKGEVITYQNKKDSRITTTHRIMEIKDDEFITKGDANDAVDSNPVAKDLILGRVALVIPFLGYPIAFTKTLPGLIVLVVIPATIIIYSELLNIKKEIFEFLAKRRKDD